MEVGKDPVKITIPAESNANLSMDNTAGKIVTVSTAADANWSLQYDKVSFANYYGDGTGEVSIEMKKGVWEMMLLTNNSEKAVEFTIKAEKSDAVDLKGTFDNPYEIKVEKESSGEGDVESYMAIMPEGLSIAAKSDGVYLTLKAPKDGLVAFQMNGSAFEYTDEVDEEWGTYKSVNHPVQFSITNITTSKASEVCINKGSEDNVCSVPASKGDEIQIWINTYNEKDEWETPAADGFGSYGVLFPELGEKFNPEPMESGKEYTFKTPLSYEDHYYVFTAEQAGVLKVTFSTQKDQGYKYNYTDLDAFGEETVIKADGKEETKEINLKAGESIVIYASAYAEDTDWENHDDRWVKVAAAFTADIEKDIKDGATVKVDTPKDQAVIGTSVLEAAKGKDVNLVMDMGGYTWTINGKDITSASALDLTITPDTPIVFNDADKKDIIADNKYQTFSIAYDGKLGLKATLTFKVDAAYNDMKASLYRDDAKGLVGASEVPATVKDGKVSFVFDHASDYVIVFTQSPETGTAPVSVWVVVLAMMFGCAMIAAYKKMRA